MDIELRSFFPEPGTTIQPEFPTHFGAQVSIWRTGTSFGPGRLIGFEWRIISLSNTDLFFSPSLGRFSTDDQFWPGSFSLEPAGDPIGIPINDGQRADRALRAMWPFPDQGYSATWAGGPITTGTADLPDLDLSGVQEGDYELQLRIRGRGLYTRRWDTFPVPFRIESDAPSLLLTYPSEVGRLANPDDTTLRGSVSFAGDPLTYLQVRIRDLDTSLNWNAFDQWTPHARAASHPATVDGDTWSFDFVGLASGSGNFEVELKAAAANNRTIARTIRFRLDQGPATTSIMNPTKGTQVSNRSLLEIQGTVHSPSPGGVDVGVTIEELSTNRFWNDNTGTWEPKGAMNIATLGADRASNLPMACTYAWNLGTALDPTTQGSYQITFTPFESQPGAGLREGSSSTTNLDVVIDTTEPTTGINFPVNDQVLARTTHTFLGTAADDFDLDLVYLQLDRQNADGTVDHWDHAAQQFGPQLLFFEPTALLANGDWTYTWVADDVDGDSFTFGAQAHDLAGNFDTSPTFVTFQLR